MAYIFDAIKVRDKAVEWIKEQAETQGFTRVVLGISGGKDSAVAAALCCRALGAENVHGILMPNGDQADISDSYKICEALGIRYHEINIKPIYDTYRMQYSYAVADKSDIEVTGMIDISVMDKLTTEQAKINLAPRIRMTMLRFYGQSNKCRVCGTGNLSEYILGYYTKDGDNRSDFNPLRGLTSDEVVEIGKTMAELPIEIITKAPSDGLTGKTDEEVMGIKYTDVHKYARNLDVDRDTWYKIHDMEIKNLHKRSIPVFEPNIR